MIIILILLVFLTSLIWLHIKWTQVKTYWLVKNVPHRKPNIILGSLTFLMKQNPAVWMRQLYKDFRSPYGGIWLFWRPGLVINSPEISRRILIKDMNIFRNRFLSSTKKDSIGSLNIFTANDPLWTNIRRRLTPVFTASKLRGLQNLMLTKSKNLNIRIQDELKNNRIIDLRSVFSDYTTDIIGETTFGVQCDATVTGQSALRDVTKEFMEYSILRGISFISMFFIPELCDIFGWTFFPKKATDYLVFLFKEVVKKRGGYENADLKHNDVLDALIKLKREAAKEGEDINEEVLIAQAAILMQGGFDTTAVTLTFTIYELAHQPVLQERLYNELKEAKEAIGDADFDSNHLAELPYLNAVINDPETFDPDRFMPENEDNIKPYTYMPFGEGPRICIGKRFAYQTVRYAMSSILLNHQVKPIPGAPKPSECTLEKKGLFLMPGAPMSVQFLPRF